MEEVIEAQIGRGDEACKRIRGSNGALRIDNNIISSAILSNLANEEWKVGTVTASDILNEGRKIVRVVGLLPFEGIAFSLVPEHPYDLSGIPGILEGGQSGSNGITESRVTGTGSRCPVVIQGGPTLSVLDDRIGHRGICIRDLATKGDLHAKFSLGSHGDAPAA